MGFDLIWRACACCCFVLLLVLPAHAAAPQLQVESSAIVGSDNLAIAANGRLIAEEQEGIVTLRDGQSGRTLRRWRVSNEKFTGFLKLCFPGDHRTLAVMDGSEVTLWDTASGRLLEWNAETEWSTTMKKECVDGLGVLAQNTWDAKARELKLSGLRLPDSQDALPQWVVPSKSGNSHRLIAVPGGQFVGIGQYQYQADESKPKSISLSLLEITSGKLRWQVADIPGDIQTSAILGETITTLAISPDGRHLAYVQPSRGRDGQSAKWLSTGPVVVLDALSGKRRQLPGFGKRQAQRVAFVNDGAWLMIAEADPAVISLFDIRTGKKIRSLNGRVNAIFPGRAQSIIVEGAIIDLPYFVERARVGRQTSTLQTLSAIQQRLLVAGGDRVKEVPIIAPSQGLDIKTPVKDFVYDAVSGRIAYALGGNDSKGSIQGYIRKSSGQQNAFRLPRGDIIWDGGVAAFAPGGALLVTGHDADAVNKFQALFRAELEKFDASDSGLSASARFASALPTRYYWVSDQGAAKLAGEHLGTPSQMRIAPDGQQLWLAIDNDLVALSLPSLRELSRIKTGDAVFDFHLLADGQSQFVRMADSIALWRNGKRNSELRIHSSAALAGLGDAFYVAEGQKLYRWFPERQVPSIAPIPSNTLVSENLSHYVRNGVAGAERIAVADGEKKTLGALCKKAVLISADGRYLLCECATEKKFLQEYAIVDGAARAEVRTFEHVSYGGELAFSADSQSVFYIRRERIELEQQAAETIFSLMEMQIATGAQQVVYSTKDSISVKAIKTSDNGAVIGIAFRESSQPGSIKVLRKQVGRYTLLSSIETNAVRKLETLDISPQGDLIAFGDNAVLSVHDTGSGARLQQIQTTDSDSVRFDPSGKRVAGINITRQNISVYDIASGRLVQAFNIPNTTEEARQLRSLPFGTIAEKALLLTRQGVVEPTAEAALRHPLSALEQRLHEILFVDDAAITSIAQLSPELLALLRKDGLITLFDPIRNSALARIAIMPSGNWVVIAPDGRFDTSSLEDLAALHWVLPDEPYSPLPLELFMRQYYEPGLMQKLVHGLALAPLPDLSALNRAQPQVTIEKVSAAPDAQLVDVTVKFEQGAYAGLRNGQAIRERSGLRHVRLFRNGQLVGTLADEANSAIPQHWTFQNIRLPGGNVGRDIEFSAYAFNVDGVKGPTHTLRYRATKATPSSKRAVILGIGVNQYENPRFDLAYAAHDARSFGQALAQRLRASGRYSEVISHSLVSDQTTPGAASKGNIRNLFAGMAGEFKKARLPVLKPDDTLIVFFAGHGVLDDKGEFYLLPHDIGPKRAGNVLQLVLSQAEMDRILQRSISSAELANWLQGVDAQEIVLVVDACHSAGALGGKEFKPGPMGSRGLGQLAYDKGMRILAATQADDVALEVGNLQHGLLTYTLLRNGLEKAEADFRPKDGAVLLGEWLQFATDGVPRLARQVLEEQAKGRGAPFKARGSEDSLTSLQQPTLFDFRRSQVREVRLQ